MLFKKLYSTIIIRVLLIASTCFLLPFAMEKYNDIIINSNIIAFIIIQVILLIKRLNFVNRDLIAFFDSIKYDDSTVMLSNEFQDQNYFRLSKRLMDVNMQIQKLKTSIVSREQYFRAVTEHAGVGLMTYTKDGTVGLCNKAAKDLLKISDLSNIHKLGLLYPNLLEALTNIKASEQMLVELKLDKDKNQNTSIQLSIRATEFKTNSDGFKLVSLQDIKHDLDDKEIKSWQKLVQILRHEIMNSISPISSTIDTLNELIINQETKKEYTVDELNNEIISDVASGLKIIKERNVGIMDFVQKFKTISKLPSSQFSDIDIRSFLNDIQIFWKNDLLKNRIEFISIIGDDVEFIRADKNQLEQVLINLIKNSIEALTNRQDGKIELRVFKLNTGQIQISICDNGNGIAPDLLDEIFLPFFTTKEQGSGIGLSLIRQIMRLHGGGISVHSKPGIETVFTLSF